MVGRILNAACVVTLIDRLVHNAEIIHIKGDSYRLKEAQECAEQRAKKRKPAAEHNMKTYHQPSGLTQGLDLLADKSGAGSGKYSKPFYTSDGYLVALGSPVDYSTDISGLEKTLERYGTRGIDLRGSFTGGICHASAARRYAAFMHRSNRLRRAIRVAVSKGQFSDELQKTLAKAHAQGRWVMLDFYADWCASCKEMMLYTFSDPKVKEALSPVVLVQADVTQNLQADRALLKQFNLTGPPAILFFSPDQREHESYRVIGYMKAEQFLAQLGIVK